MIITFWAIQGFVSSNIPVSTFYFNCSNIISRAMLMRFN